MAAPSSRDDPDDKQPFAGNLRADVSVERRGEPNVARGARPSLGELSAAPKAVHEAAVEDSCRPDVLEVIGGFFHAFAGTPWARDAIAGYHDIGGTDRLSNSPGTSEEDHRLKFFNRAPRNTPPLKAPPANWQPPWPRFVVPGRQKVFPRRCDGPKAGKFVTRRCANNDVDAWPGTPSFSGIANLPEGGQNGVGIPVSPVRPPRSPALTGRGDRPTIDHAVDGIVIHPRTTSISGASGCFIPTT
jgi:hypothetical protein